MILLKNIEVVSDLHAHTLCSDGIVEIKESIEIRLKKIQGLNIVGISDHYRFIAKTNEIWNNYINEIAMCKKLFENQVKVKAGIEIFFHDLEKFMDVIRFQDLDFIIIERFESVENIITLTKVIGDTRQVFKGEIIIAHPEFIYSLNQLGQEEFIKFLEYLKYNEIPLEINTCTGYFFDDIDDDYQKKIYEKSFIANALRENESLMSVGTDSHDYVDGLYHRFNEIYNFFRACKE